LNTGSGFDSGSLKGGGSGDASCRGGLFSPNGDGIGYVVRFPNPPSSDGGDGIFESDHEGSFGGAESNGEGGGSDAPNGDGGAVGGGAEDLGGSGLGLPASGGISITCSSCLSPAISRRISSSDANIVFKGSFCFGSCKTSSSRFGGSIGGGGIAAEISSGRATIVLYGSTGGAASTSGVPSTWQKRIESSKVFSQVGHFFIDYDSSNGKAGQLRVSGY